MLFSAPILAVFIFWQCIQLGIDQAHADKEFTSSPANAAGSGKLVRTRELRFGLSQQKKEHARCPSHLKKCRGKANVKTKHPFKNRNKDKRCCKKRNKLCLRKLRKRCKTPKCSIKQSRRCQKQFSRCNKRKSTNRRPGNCGASRRRKSGKNQQPRPSPTPQTTTVKPVVKKREKEECSESEACAEGLCCARHQHVRICKPLIQKDQVCTREYKFTKRSPEMYERCPCAEGLACAASKLEIRHYTCQIAT